MSRFVTVSLDKRGVSCVARLLDDAAPRTCAAVWDSLPLSAQVFHGKYARNEIYTLLPAFARVDPGKENTTVTPIPGDLCWFSFDSDDLGHCVLLVDEVPAGREGDARSGVENCPEQALSLED